MKPKKYSPGLGWKKLSNSVFENGEIRVHLGGTVRKNGAFIPGNTAYSDMFRFIQINGGNRKRGIMAWGRSL